MQNLTGPEDAQEPGAEPAYGLFGPGIFGTGIDLSNLDGETAWKLGLFVGEQVMAAEQRGYERGAKASQAMRVLLIDASKIMAHAAENDIEIGQRFAAWRDRLEAVLAGGAA